MTERERLIELLKEKQAYGKTAFSIYPISNEEVADHLLANGVIVPPCKVGDKMYKLCSVNSKIEMGSMWDGRTVETNCDRCGYRSCYCHNIGLRERNNPNFIDVIEEKTISSLEFLVRIMPYVGTIWFTTKEEAEQALKGGGSDA